LSAAATGIRITTLLTESLPQRIDIAPAVESREMAPVYQADAPNFIRFKVCSGMLLTRRWNLLTLAVLSLAFAGVTWGQTVSTGALTGQTLGPTGAVLTGVTLHLNNQDGSEVKSATSDSNGRFAFLLLPPGTYEVKAGKLDFKPVSQRDIHVHVTETLRLELHLELATRLEHVEVSSNPQLVQLDSSALGRVVDKDTVSRLPLATRNFTQIAGLSPGVAVGVYNAGELGTGATAQSQIGPSSDGVFVHGARSYDNNWQMDGVSVSDVLGSGPLSGGIPIPNPDTLEEFKVQTGVYDAEFGRGAGANVSVITKAGTDHFHGTVFEYWRNDVLNANDFFLNKTGQERPSLKQNQFGLVLGGPIRKDHLFFLGSYQGTRQINGTAAGQARVACTVTLSEPPLTNDRSLAALGGQFAGLKGASGGVAIQPNGSNINPVALALLNFKLPDGTFLIPTPQTVDYSRPFASRGFSAFTQPCNFQEDQGLATVDTNISEKSRLAARFFMAADDQLVTFPGGALNPTGNIRGFDSPDDSDFVVFSLAHTYVFSNALLNQARIGFVRTSTTMGADAPFKWSDVGVSEGEMNRNNELPSLNIAGSVSMTTTIPRTYAQGSFVFNDVLSFLKGSHAIRFGSSLTRSEDNLDFNGFGSFVQFLSWPDFLLGLDANSNGTGSVSNVFASSDTFGLLNREYRVWEGSGSVQDDYRMRPSLTLNLGLRYERLGQFGDKLGRNSSFDVNKADGSPPADGSLDGYIVASNFPGALPPGVIRAGNTFANYGEGQDTFAPRTGFAWQILPRTIRLALRGGYGMYYSRSTGQSAAKSVIAAPFALPRAVTGLANAAATFQAPFAQPFPASDSFPMFVPYSPTTSSSINAQAPNFRPALVQQFSLNLQGEFAKDWLLEVGYVGSRGTHLQRLRSQNQALSASVNTLANIGSRVPVPGVRPDALREMESEGNSWYNGLEGSLTKRLSRGLQLLASYTFSKTLDTDGADVNSTSAGVILTLGDQNSPRQRWGRASSDRTHRFVFSETWSLPSPSAGLQRSVLRGWATAAVVTIQSGSALTIADTNTNNVFGINEDRAQLSGACPNKQLIKPGSMASKLGGYFNAACFTTPPIIGSDGIGTGFGNSATGIVDGPGQANLDVAFTRTVALGGPFEKTSLQFRAEFFNALNHPQFANPDSNFTSPTFGLISSTAVNARVGQLALRYEF
jgi:Carboxypeptidase regulatory-like domain/TonB-dependent Receptor Plug Domain